MKWNPKYFKRFGARLETSMETCRIHTDAGEAYIKCLGNKTGPHGLACEWIGTSLAKAMGLPTFDFAILNLTDDDVPFEPTSSEQPGPAFITRQEAGTTWDETRSTLELLVNPHDIPSLIVLDTWLANYDRHSPSGDRKNQDNVFFSSEGLGPNEYRLIAMDFSHCIGRMGELSTKVSEFWRIRDDGIYGVFDAFIDYIDQDRVNRALTSLGRVTDDQIDAVLNGIPKEWEVGSGIAASVRTFLCGRRDYVVKNFCRDARTQIGPQLSWEIVNE